MSKLKEMVANLEKKLKDAEYERGKAEARPQFMQSGQQKP